jgi:hypothetical protein
LGALVYLWLAGFHHIPYKVSSFLRTSHRLKEK